MRVAHGSQPFRRDTERSDIHEAEPFLARGGDDNHDHPAEEVSLQRLHVLARRIAFPFARRIPRVTKRYSSPYNSTHVLTIIRCTATTVDDSGADFAATLGHSDGVFGRWRETAVVRSTVATVICTRKPEGFLLEAVARPS